jgi:hypothetical protein
VEQVRPGAWPEASAKPQEVSRRSSSSSPSGTWPCASLDTERRFAQPHAKLFPFIGRKVKTPAGTGTLIQVFAGRVTVLLESDMEKCAFFKPAEIEPVSWEP